MAGRYGHPIIAGKLIGQLGDQSVRCFRRTLQPRTLKWGVYDGEVVKTTKFGAFVEVLPGKSGLIHISELSNTWVDKVTDVIRAGEVVRAKCIEIDDKGRVMLSLRTIDQTLRDISSNVSSAEKPFETSVPPSRIENLVRKEPPMLPTSPPEGGDNVRTGQAKSNIGPVEAEFDEYPIQSVCPTFGRVLNLACQLRKEILDPTRRALNKIDGRYEKDIQNTQRQCEDAISHEKAEFDRVAENAAREKQSVADKCRPSLQEVKQTLKSVKEHLRGFGIDLDKLKPDETTETALVSTEIRELSLQSRIEKGRKMIESINYAAQTDILSKSPPKYPYRPNIVADWGGLSVVSFIVGVFFGVNSGSFFIFLVATVGFYWAWLLGFRALAVSGIRHASTQLLPKSGRAQSLLEGCNAQAEESASEAVRLAEAILKVKTCKENDEAERLQDISRQKRDQDVEELSLELAPKLNEMHSKFDDFVEKKLFVAGEWDHESWKKWEPAGCPDLATRFGTMRVQAGDLENRFPDLNFRFVLPATIPFLEGRSLLLKPKASKAVSANHAVQALIARLISTTPPGMLRFTFIDPLSLGSNVAAFMDLANFEESLIHSRAWSEPQHIEKRMGELTEHMETVIQKYLRTEFDSIHQYNDAANEVAEPYRFVIVFDFPVNFTETAARRLLSIVRNGAKCGVFAIIVVDQTKELPYGFSLSEIEREVVVVNEREKPASSGTDLFREFGQWEMSYDSPAPQEVLDRIINGFGELSQEAMRVEVPFEKLLTLADLDAKSHWSASTADRIHVPLGPTGARKVQYLTLGEGTGHHALLVGRPGSGKSNLMHVIIASIALAYEPEEIRLFLIDFKKGVEFKPYAVSKLPHAEAIAVESEREFGLSVLERLDEELRERGELFREVGAVEISEFRAKSGKKLPRLLLLVDEFQEFFALDDLIARETNRFLDRLVRQGRAFGIHIILASQNLPRTQNLSESTLDQMAIRIAMQCSEADSRRILADDNPAARLLSRPGEAIYNSASGLVEGNQIFQVALLSEESRLEQIKRIERLAEKHCPGKFVPIVFEGNEVSSLSDCGLLDQMIECENWADKGSSEFLLGEPVAICPPITTKVRRQSGCHLLVISRDEKEGIGICSSAVLSILATQSPTNARLFVANFSLAETDFADGVDAFSENFPHDIKIIRRQPDLVDLVKDIADEVTRRLNGKQEPTSFYLVLLGIQRMRRLRPDDGWNESGDPTPSELLEIILRDGPEVGIHVVGWCDTFANISRVVERRVIDEFGLRAGGVMSADESLSFFDDAAASKIDKEHRFLFFDQEKPGRLEKFRPYSIPGNKWFQEMGENLKRRSN